MSSYNFFEIFKSFWKLWRIFPKLFKTVHKPSGKKKISDFMTLFMASNRASILLNMDLMLFDKKNLNLTVSCESYLNWRYNSNVFHTIITTWTFN
jgi:hypothetical protein